MNRPLVVAVAVFLFAVALSAQEPEPCPSLRWTFESGVENDKMMFDLASIDYDEDGKLDLVGVFDKGPGYRDMLVWWKGEGDNKFRKHLWTSIYHTGKARNIVIADATGDGLSDVIAVPDDQSSVVILPATGSGRGPALTKTLSKPGLGTIAAIQRDTDPAVELVVTAEGPRRLDIYDDIATTPRLTASVQTEMTPTGITSADFDGDGNLDMAVAIRDLDERGMSVYFGNAGGTFEAPVALPSIRPFLVESGDLNEDGRPDLVAVNWKKGTRSGAAAATASIYLNRGDRNFIHSLLPLAKLDGLGIGTMMILRDLNGDGHLDLLAGDESRNATAIGRGDGSFLTPTFEYLRFGPQTAGDFDGDGKLDFAMGYTNLDVATSTCTTQVSLESTRSDRVYMDTLPRAAVIGEEVDLRVEISGFGPGPPMQHGRVILRDDSTILDSSFVDRDGRASFVVSGLAAGLHPLTAEFSGNAVVPPATSDVLPQRVGQPTPIMVSLPSPLPVYGEAFPIQIIMNNVAWVTLDIDGMSRNAHPDYPINLSVEPGNHTVSAKFAGTHYLPPGQSALVTFTVAKAHPVLELNGSLALRESEQALAFTVKGSGAIGPSGTVQLIEGTTTIASGALINGSTIVNVAFSHGDHAVRAVYSGDARYREVSRNLKFEVLQNLPFPIEAHAMPGGIRIAYVLPQHAIRNTLQLFRRPAGATEWAVVPGWNQLTGMDASVPLRGVVYEYRLLATFTNASRSYSSIDSAMLSNPRRRAVSP